VPPPGEVKATGGNVPVAGVKLAGVDLSISGGVVGGTGGSFVSRQSWSSGAAPVAWVPLQGREGGIRGWGTCFLD
jgi:hypothetical protein